MFKKLAAERRVAVIPPQAVAAIFQKMPNEKTEMSGRTS
jgi:hypothetical protein